MVNKKYLFSIVISVLSLLAIVFVVANIFILTKQGMRTEDEMNRLVLFIVATGVFLFALLCVIAFIIRSYRKNFVKEEEEDLDFEIDEELMRQVLEEEKAKEKASRHKSTE